MHFDLVELLKSFGPYAMFAIWGIVFTESGIFFGFFFPGDSLLFTAGVLASQGFMPIEILTIGVFFAATFGVSTGYWFGKTFGRRIFESGKLPLVKKHHIEAAEEFYKKHGKKTIILARFIPAVRTFAPIVAGIGKMDYRTFITYNIIGAMLWGTGLTLGGYFLGKLIPAKDVDKVLLPIVLVIIVVSVLPAISHVIADERKRKTHTTKESMKDPS